MIGKSIISVNKTYTNDEFKKVLEKRRIKFIILFVVGMFTVLLVFFAKALFGVQMNEHTKDFYFGVGTGIMVSSVVLLIQQSLILKDKEKIKKKRLKETDERNVAIGNLAWKMASVVFLFSIYIMGIILGVFNTKYLFILTSFIIFFFFLYSVFFWYFSKNM